MRYSPRPIVALVVLAGFSLVAGPCQLSVGADGFRVEGMRFKDRAMAERVLAVRNMDLEFRSKREGAIGRDAVVERYVELLARDNGKTRDAMCRRATYALFLGELHCWWRGNRKDAAADRAKSIAWWRKARAWSQADQEYVFWTSSSGLVSAYLGQGKRLAAFLEAARSIAMDPPRSPTGKGYRRDSANRAKTAVVRALVPCGAGLPSGVVLDALRQAEHHADPVVSDCASRLVPKAATVDEDPFALPEDAYLGE
jgi:hypothetical protein